MKIGYFTIPYKSQVDFIDWSWIYQLEVIERKNFFVHAKAPNPLLVKMDGKTGQAVIFKGKNT